MISPEGGLVAAAVRGLVDAGLFSSFGSLLFRWWLLPPDSGGLLDARLWRLTYLSLMVTQLALLAWADLVAGVMSGATSLAQGLQALPLVLRATSFGHVLSTQVILLVGTGATAMRRRTGWSLGTAALALVLQAGHSHAYAMTAGPSLLLLSVGLHLLAGGAWLGSLLPLLLTVRSSPEAIVIAAVRRYASLGQACVVVLGCSALFQGWILIGSLQALTGTAYGWMACSKLLLFTILLALAGLNRFRFTPRLAGANPAPARRQLARSITVETATGVLLLLAAGTLANLPPGMHMSIS